MNHNQFSLFATKRFLPLVITQFLGAFNDNLFKNALVILITYVMTTQTGNSAQVLVVLAGAILILPFFIFSATAGQLADKYDKAMLSRWIKFAEIVLMLLAVLGFYLNDLYFLLAVLFLMGAQSAFFGPIKYGILPDHLAEHELVAGNAFIETTTFLAILTGAMLGGLIVLETNGIMWISIWIVGVAIAGWISSLFIPSTRPAMPDLQIGPNIALETWRIIDYIRKDSIVLHCAIGTSWFWMLGGNFLSLFPALAKDVIGANEQVVTLFLLSFSLGVTAGSLMCNQLLKGQVHADYVPIAALGMSLFMADAYLVSSSFTPTGTTFIGLTAFLTLPGSWHLLFSLVMVAVCGGVFIVPLYALLQHQSADSHRARNIGASNVLNALFIVVGGIGSALLLAWGFTIPQVFLIMAMLNISVLIAAHKLLPGALARTVIGGLLGLIYRIEARGLENLRNLGPRVLLVPNHLSFLDAVLIAVCVRENLTFAIDTFIAQQRWIKFFLRITKAKTQQVDPSNPLALRTLVAALKTGERVVIFPEGRISVTGGIMKVYEGPALVAEKAAAILLPVRLDGPQYTNFSRLQDKFTRHWFPRLTLHFLPPKHLSIPDHIHGRSRRQYAGNRLYDLLTLSLLEANLVQNSGTLFQALLIAQRLHGAKRQVLEDTNFRPLTYKGLLIASFTLGRAMGRATNMGERVGLLLPNVLGVVVSFFALQAYGRTPTMLNYSTGITNILHACRIAQLRVVYSSRKFIAAGKLDALVQAITDAGIQVIYLEDLRAQLSIIDKFWGLLAATIPQFAYNHTCPQRDPNSPAVVLFTSGTEGIPKGVVLSHNNIQANRNQVMARVDFSPKDRVFNALPLFHSFGLSTGTLLPLLSGLRVFLYPSPLHYRMVPELVYSTNATILFSTDTFLTGYAHYAHPYDFYNLRLVFSGAERLKEETRRIYSERFGVRLLEGYGVTETAPVLAVNTPICNRVGTVGRLLPGINWQLAPVDGIVDGGSLLVCGPNVMLGYLQSAAPGVLQPPPDGWYDTGDVAEVDSEGYITIKGRLKRFAKIGGEMISLAAVETQVGQLWPNYAHAVVAVPDVRRGERLVLVTTHPYPQRDELLALVQHAGLATIAVPKNILSLPQLPLLGTGKLDYGQIRILAEQSVVSKEAAILADLEATAADDDAAC